MLYYICTGLFSLHVGSLFFGSNRSIIGTDKSRQGNNFPRVYFSEVIYMGLCTQVDHARDAVSECACSTWVCMDRKLPEKKNEVTSRKAATFIPKAQERGESEDWRHNKKYKT